jgi:hypothetical protein
MCETKDSGERNFTSWEILPLHTIQGNLIYINEIKGRTFEMGESA